MESTAPLPPFRYTCVYTSADLRWVLNELCGPPVGLSWPAPVYEFKVFLTRRPIESDSQTSERCYWQHKVPSYYSSGFEEWKKRVENTQENGSILRSYSVSWWCKRLRCVCQVARQRIWWTHKILFTINIVINNNNNQLEGTQTFFFLSQRVARVIKKLQSTSVLCFNN